MLPHGSNEEIGVEVMFLHIGGVPMIRVEIPEIPENRPPEVPMGKFIFIPEWTAGEPARVLFYTSTIPLRFFAVTEEEARNTNVSRARVLRCIRWHREPTEKEREEANKMFGGYINQSWGSFAG